MPADRRGRFWVEALSIGGSLTLHVLPQVLAFGALAALICVIDGMTVPQVGVEVGPHEVAGGVLGLLLVLRSNAGYDRWWEARKLWGAIVNQSRNLGIAAMAYGPDDPDWRGRFVRRVAAFAHVATASLRGRRELPEVAALLGPEEASRIAAAGHMPGRVARDLAGLLREARDRHGLDPFAFLQIDRERALLIDHIGGCERINKTPLTRVSAIVVRRFILVYLMTLPLALILKLGWLTPLATMLVAYPILELDQLGVELQAPFDPRSLGHLPLDEFGRTIEANLLELLDEPPGSS